MLGTWLGIGSAAKLGHPNGAVPGCVLRDFPVTCERPLAQPGWSSLYDTCGVEVLERSDIGDSHTGLCRWIGVCGHRRW